MLKFKKHIYINENDRVCNQKMELGGARADKRNRTSISHYYSGSESDFESVDETDSDSNVNGRPYYQRKSLECSPLAPTSESSFKLRTSDVISSFTSQHSDITDELILPVSSLTQSPPVQVMDRNGGRDHCQSVASSFSSKSSSPSWSTDSGESLFSLQINSNSFTHESDEDEIRSSVNSYSFTESEAFSQLEELRMSNMDSSRQSLSEARVHNISIGETIPRKNVDGHEESSVEVSEGLSRAHHYTSHQDDFVLPLSFPTTDEKKKKKKKKKSGFTSYSCTTCSWPSCSLKCLSCSGCFKCQLPSCSCNCLTSPCRHCMCSSWSCCCNSSKSSYSCDCASWNCKRKSYCLTCC